MTSAPSSASKSHLDLPRNSEPRLAAFRSYSEHIGLQDLPRRIPATDDMRRDPLTWIAPQSDLSPLGRGLLGAAPSSSGHDGADIRSRMEGPGVAWYGRDLRGVGASWISRSCSAAIDRGTAWSRLSTRTAMSSRVTWICCSGDGFASAMRANCRTPATIWWRNWARNRRSSRATPRD